MVCALRQSYGRLNSASLGPSESEACTVKANEKGMEEGMARIAPPAPGVIRAVVVEGAVAHTLLKAQLKLC